MMSKDLMNDPKGSIGDGCEYCPHCLECPFPFCQFDDPQGFKQMLDSQRGEKIYQDYIAGATITELARKYQCSYSTIQRAIRLMKRGQKGVDKLKAPAICLKSKVVKPYSQRSPGVKLVVVGHSRMRET
jgi:hypothetical protein